ncbi:MAG: uracil-DNA glycosylase [Polyangiaceae bacterium]
MRAELLDLTRALKAHLAWQEECGTEGLPPAPEVVEDLAVQAAPLETSPRALRPAADLRPVDPPRAPQAAAQQSAGLPTAPKAPTQPTASVLTLPTSTAAPPLSLEERRRRLDVLRDTVKSCTRCGLAGGRIQTVFARGNPAAELCFVGEGPGADEDEQGEPFVGKAGQLLDKMIAGMRLGGDEIYIANIVKCRPPQNRVPERDEMDACMPYLVEQLDLIKPKVIVALGATALRGLIGPGPGIMKSRGTWKLYRGEIPVMPTFHPSYVLRVGTREVKQLVWSDLQQVLVQLGKPLPPRSTSG